jgi:hypothetical protein
MAGLSLIVFPAIGAIGVIKYLGTPAEKRTEAAKKYFKRYALGFILMWFGFELKGELPPMILVVMTLGGFYLWFFSGVSLFSEDAKKE